MASDAGAPTGNGLSILWDVVVAPRAAFAALRERPYVGWAFLITCLLGMAGALLQIPAGEHIAVATFAGSAAHDPQIAAMTPEQQQRALGFAKTAQHWFWVFYPVLVGIAVLVTALVMLVFNAIGKGDGSFRKFLALAANVALINFGISYILLGALVQLRGGDAFSKTVDLVLAMPSLAWLAPGGPVKLVTFLSTFNVFGIWSFVLLGFGLRDVARVAPVWAWIGAAVIAVCPALIASASAR